MRHANVTKACGLIILVGHLHLADAPAADDPAAADLGKTLKTLRVTQVDADGARVAYIPTDLRATDSKGKATVLEAIPIGKEALVTGRLSLVADEVEVAALRNEASTRSHNSVILRQVNPSTFGVWLYVDNKEVWNRPVAEGRVEGLPVQATVDARPKGSTTNARAVAVLIWSETMPPIGVKATIDWEAASAQLKRAVTEGGLLTIRELQTFVEQALEKGWVSLQWKGSAPENTARVREEVRAAVQAEVTRTLLERPQPRAIADQRSDSQLVGGESRVDHPEARNNVYSVAFKLRAQAKNEARQTVLDLTTSRRIERHYIITVTIPIRF